MENDPKNIEFWIQKIKDEQLRLRNEWIQINPNATLTEAYESGFKAGGAVALAIKKKYDHRNEDESDPVSESPIQ